MRGAEGDTGELSQPALHRWLRMLLRKCSVVYSCLTRTSQTKRCETATSMCVCRLPDGCRPGCGGSGLRAGTPSLPRPPALAAVCPQRPSVQVPVSSGFPRCTERVPDSCGGGGSHHQKKGPSLGSLAVPLSCHSDRPYSEGGELDSAAGSGVRGWVDCVVQVPQVVT